VKTPKNPDGTAMSSSVSAAIGPVRPSAFTVRDANTRRAMAPISVETATIGVGLGCWTKRDR